MYAIIIQYNKNHIMSDESFKDALMNLLLHMDSMDIEEGIYMRVADALTEIYNNVGHNNSALSEDDDDEANSIAAAIVHDNYDTLRMIVERNNYNFNDHSLQLLSYLITAIEYSSIQCLTYLVEEKHVDVNISINGIMPLQLAYEVGITRIIDYLRLHGAV